MTPKRLSDLNAQGRELRARWLPLPASENDVTAAIKALHELEETLPESSHMWRTAQLADGKIAGMFNASPERTVVALAFWWGSDVVWVVDDPGCLIHDRYRESVRAKDYHAARWVVTAGPVEVLSCRGSRCRSRFRWSFFRRRSMFACSKCGEPLGMRVPGERRARHVCTSPDERCGFYRQVGKHVYAPVKQGHWGEVVGYSCIECGKEKE